jgi:hypothetical protein
MRPGVQAEGAPLLSWDLGPNRTLDRWDTTITETPRKARTGRLNSTTRQVEVWCR